MMEKRYYLDTMCVDSALLMMDGDPEVFQVLLDRPSEVLPLYDEALVSVQQDMLDKRAASKRRCPTKFVSMRFIYCLSQPTVLENTESRLVYFVYSEPKR